ncbi:MAG: hypothetical protein NVSMB9_31250 [Isosphaeraceae bacterium]
MSVTAVNEILPKRGSIDNLWQRSYTRTFRVQTDSPHDGPKIVRLAVDPVTGVKIPSIGFSYTNGTNAYAATESDFGSFVQSVTPECEEAGANPAFSSWKVTVEYGPYNTSLFQANPITWPIRIAFGEQKDELVVTKDQAGNAIVNSAGERYADPVTIDDTRSVITIARNEAVHAYDWTLPELYRDKINNAPWNGYPTKTVKCASIITSQPQYNSDAQVWYFEVTYVFEINRDTWTKSLLDQGYAEINAIDATKRSTIRDRDGQPIAEPSLLDGAGHKLAVNGTPVFRPHDVYPAVDFSVFNIDFNTALGRA